MVFPEPRAAHDKNVLVVLDGREQHIDVIVRAAKRLLEWVDALETIQRIVLIGQPTRELLLLLIVTEYATIPSPMPLLLEVTEIQSALLVAVQTQPVPLVLTVNVPPLAIPVSVTCDGESENVHGWIRLKTVPNKSTPASGGCPEKIRGGGLKQTRHRCASVIDAGEIIQRRQRAVFA